MPVRLGKIPGTGAIAFLHSCEVCDKDASFGMGVKFSKALQAVSDGKLDLAKELLGKWYCLTHWRKVNAENN